MKHLVYLGCTLLMGSPAPQDVPTALAFYSPGAPLKGEAVQIPGSGTGSESRPESQPGSPSKVGARRTPPAKPAPATSGSADPADVTTWVARVQAFYDGMEDYSATFIQRYTRIALSRTAESRGRLLLKKPGMMRWEYEKPGRKLWVADGRKLTVYDEEEDEYYVDPDFEVGKLGSSVSFLWGKGKLSDAFQITLGDPTAHGAPRDSKVLELTPKEDATYTKLVLVLASEGGAVAESILYETSGNTNHFKFLEAKLNTGLKDSIFRLEVPPNPAPRSPG